MNNKGKFLRVSYLLLVIAIFFKFHSNAFRSGLDASWVDAINMLVHEGILWGKSIIFTYGPLGFLLLPVPVGNNSLYSLLFWTALTLLAAGTFAYILFRKRTFSNNIFLSFLLLYAGTFSLGYMLPEYALSCLVLILLSLCWHDDALIPFMIAVVICVISLFMKFNGGLLNFLTVIMFAGLAVLSQKKYRKLYFAAVCLIPVIFCMGFLSYNPSIQELIFYVRGALEISSGYNSAMSVEIYKTSIYVLLTAIAAVLGVVLYVFSFFRVRHSMKYAMIFAVPVFMSLKHGLLVRHWVFFMPMLYVYASIYVLFMEDELKVNFRMKKFLEISLCVFFCSTFMLSFVRIHNTDNYILNNNFTRRFITNPAVSLINNIKSLSGFNTFLDNRAVKLSDDFKQYISNDTATSYPWEMSAALDIPNYVNMPVIQAYSSYTPWLDRQNADFFGDDTRAPRFIIFSMDTIDERFALIESPASWLEIFKNYKIAMRLDKNFLLKRADISQITQWGGGLITREFPSDETVIIPDADYCLMRLELPLSLLGHLAEIFYCIPRLNMRVEFQDGRVITKRVIAGVLSNETMISPLPEDEDSFEAVMAGDSKAGKVKSIRLEGPGLKYYAPEMKITFMEMIPLS